MDTGTPTHMDEDLEHINYEEFFTLSVLKRTSTDETPLPDHEQKFKGQLRDCFSTNNFFIRKIRELYDRDEILGTKFNKNFGSQKWKIFDKGYMKIRKEKIDVKREEVLKKKVERGQNNRTSKLTNDKTSEKSSASGTEQEFKAQPNDYSFIKTRLFRKVFVWCDEQHIRYSDKIQTHGSEEQKRRDREKMERRKSKIDDFRMKDAKLRARS
jgi:hypothetical protein